jgi:hypothetical protein
MDNKIDEILKFISELKVSNKKIISSLNANNEKLTGLDIEVDDLCFNVSTIMEDNRDFKLKIDAIEKIILIIENNKNQN